MVYISATLCKINLKYLNSQFVPINRQGFMQDKIIASHTRFGGHMDVNC